MIVVVLHQPRELVNIAHVVRAMKNFGLRDLRLVAPAEFDAWRVEGIAHRTADVLERVALFETLDAALADCVHVVGFSARDRTAKRNRQRLREAADEVLTRSRDGPVALVFGREDTGLDNAALDRCHRLVTIPTEPGYPSLQLGHAAAIACYELALARGDGARPFRPARRRAGPAEAGLLERLFADVELALEAVDFFKTRERDLIMRTVRGVIQRVPLDQREAKLLRAMAIEVRKRAGR